MKLVLLGTGGYFPTSRRQTACLMLPEIGVVLDAGSGIYRLGKYLQTEALDIFLTHAHLDHVAGLTCLLNLVPPDVLDRTTVHGHKAMLAAVREHLFAEAIFPVAPFFRFAALDGFHVLPHGGRLEHFPLTHPGGSLGFRLEWPGHSMAYVTDTMATETADYIDEIRDVDLLVHEAFFAEDIGFMLTKTGHSSLLAVAAVAAKANVRRLVAVHIDPQIEDDSVFDITAARKLFANTELAVDGMELDF
ncbi:MAG TPA: MBL fold metallo-hydrolase [Lacipirellulaceae bacterium]|nr:MBL fold metallo-hydrolase [Lacipirellulaceae bacterium]